MSRIEPEEPAFDPACWGEGEASRRLARGVALFNAGKYEEAHEEFEVVWLSTQGPDSDFYKGLLQAAIALHHFERDNLEGAVMLYAGHRRLLAAYLPAYLGVDVRAFLGEMQESLRPVVRRTPESSPRFDPERRPRIRPA